MPGGHMSCTPTFTTVPATTGAKSQEMVEPALMVPLAGVAATTVGAVELNWRKIGVTAINNILPNKNNMRSLRIGFSSSLGTFERKTSFLPGALTSAKDACGVSEKRNGRATPRKKI